MYTDSNVSEFHFLTDTDTRRHTFLIFDRKRVKRCGYDSVQLTILVNIIAMLKVRVGDGLVDCETEQM